MKKASSIISSLLCGLMVQAAQAADPYVLVFSDNPPFTVVGKDGKFSGPAISVISKLFEKAKVPFKLENQPLSRALDFTRNNERACVFPVQRAQDVEASYQWVSPITITRSGLFMAPDSNLQLITLNEAKKYKIGALRGSGDFEYLKRFGFNVDEISTQDQSLQMLLAKRIDIWATDLLSVKYFNAQAASKDKAPKEMLHFRTSLGSLACNPKTSKTDIAKLQDVLDGMIKDGTLEKLASATP